jgi:hypothetical protein
VREYGTYHVTEEGNLKFITENGIELRKKDTMSRAAVLLHNDIGLTLDMLAYYDERSLLILFYSR